MTESNTTIQRCAWAHTELSIPYHDHEWGTPIHEDQRLFEFLILEGAQAGLSWETILKKRENYRAAFDQFDPVKVAAYGEAEIAALLANPGIVRNQRKIRSAIQNARAFLAVQQTLGGFDAYLWGFVQGKPIQNAWSCLAEVPPRTPLSDQISKDLIHRGFSFVGSTICYAMLQAVGLVNDHVVDCFRYEQLKK